MHSFGRTITDALHFFFISSSSFILSLYFQYRRSQWYFFFFFLRSQMHISFFVPPFSNKLSFTINFICFQPVRRVSVSCESDKVLFHRGGNKTEEKKNKWEILRKKNRTDHYSVRLRFHWWVRTDCIRREDL